jgi:predicted RNase H-like nuclease (RuvC/YqgF family)
MQGQLSEQIAVVTGSKTGEKSMFTERHAERKSTKMTKDEYAATRPEDLEERKLSRTEKRNMIEDHVLIIKKLKNRIAVLVVENTSHLNLGKHREYQANCKRIANMNVEIKNQQQQVKNLEAIPTIADS